MKAVILVGGEGTRLRPLTCNTPKAIVPILNQPFMEHLVLYLKKHGITDIILAMGYLPDPIQACLGDGSRLGVSLTYSVEPSPLGTAGAVKYAEARLDDTFIVFNGDILTGIDLTAMIEWHRIARPKVSIALTPVDNPTIYGVVETSRQGTVRRFVEKPPADQVTTNMINAGIYIIEPDVLGLIPAGQKSMFEHHVFPLLVEMRQPVIGYPSEDYWIDIGTPEKYLKANHDLLARNGGQPLIGPDCDIAGDARITGLSVIGSGCRIGRGAVIDGAILWDNVTVGEGAALTNCIVCSASRIDKGCHISDNCILGEGITVTEASRLEPGTSLGPD